MSDKVTIYTDGACSGNPGAGGWGAILLWGDHEKTINGYDPHTTNNRMELMAAIVALEALKRPMQVALYTDSKYVKDGVTQWMAGWKANGWKTKQKKPVKNQDLWERLDNAMSGHQLDWQWVKGHSGDRYNEQADSLARQAIEDNKT